MQEEITHREIAKRFVDSKAVNFDAMGRWVTEMGPELLVRDTGFHGINFGRFNMLACMLTASDAVRLVGDLRLAGQVRTAIDGTS